MGASGLPDLRELAFMGFGRYDVTQSANFGGGTPTQAFNFTYPADGSPGGRQFRLIGYLMILDVPPDLISYAVGVGAGGVLAKTIGAQDSREPIFAFLSPEQPQVQIFASVRSYLSSAYFSGTPISMFADHLTGTSEQLDQLIKFLSESKAPTSLLQAAAQAAGGILQDVAGGDYY
jgi:hypothetical protein